MTWVPGKSGNPKGRPSGRIKKATQEVIAKLVGRDLPPSEMAAALLRLVHRLTIAKVANPTCYLRRNLQTRRQIRQRSGNRLYLDRDRVVGITADVVERVEQELGAYWAQLFRKAVASDDPGAVIDAEILSPDPAVAEQQAEPEPVKVEP
jgi:hypothetical protein